MARQLDEALGAIEREAESLAAPMTLMGRDFDAYEQAGRLVVQMEDRLLDLPPPSLFGGHQFANAGLAVAAILAFGDPRIDEEAIGRGVSSARLAGPLPGADQGAAGEGGEAARRRPLARRRPQPARRRGPGRDRGTAGGARRAARWC